MAAPSCVMPAPWSWPWPCACRPRTPRPSAQRVASALLNLRRDAIVASLLMFRIRRHDALDSERAVVRHDDVYPVTRGGVPAVGIDGDQLALSRVFRRDLKRHRVVGPHGQI